MKVAITQRHLKVEVGADRDALENDYTEYYPEFGMTLIPVSNALEDPVSFIKETGCEAIILTGGNGVMPELWGETIQYPNSFSQKREEVEKKLLEYAISVKMPVLGVCRGLHFMNVFFGGKLLQNIKEQTDSNVVHIAKNHELKIVDKNDYFSDSVMVNSFHNQAILKDMVAKDLKIWGICPGDDSIEALYHPDYPIAGITWHPERKSPDMDFNAKILKAFVNKEMFWKF